MDQRIIHSLSSLIICRNHQELFAMAHWDGAAGTSRSKLLRSLQEFISPDHLVPERRLERLVEQALQHQTVNCLYHNVEVDSLDLFSDHECPRSCTPTHTPDIFTVVSLTLTCIYSLIM